MFQCKLSIVIPTKDRYKYLLPLIQMLDSYRFKYTEVVIEDNSENNSEYIEFINDNHFEIPIVYHNNTIQIPICQNIDNAILHSKGEYVCVIGDDDAVTPLIEDYIDWMIKHGVDSVRQETEITYKWPSYSDDNGVFLGANIIHGTLGSQSYEINKEKAVENVVKKGLMTLGRMPCVYQGIVKRSTLDVLYNIGNTYFPGPSPDMANAAALSFIVNKHYVTNIPLVISGGSEFQGGKSEKIKKWVQPLEIIPFISDEAKRNWDSRIPYFWSANTVWPESAIKGLSYVNKDSYLKKMNFDLLLAKCLYEGYEYREDILSRTNNKLHTLALYVIFSLREILAKRKRYIMAKFKITHRGENRIDKIMNISEAVKYLLNVK